MPALLMRVWCSHSRAIFRARWVTAQQNRCGLTSGYPEEPGRSGCLLHPWNWWPHWEFSDKQQSSPLVLLGLGEKLQTAGRVQKWRCLLAGEGAAVYLKCVRMSVAVTGISYWQCARGRSLLSQAGPNGMAVNIAWNKSYLCNNTEAVLAVEQTNPEHGVGINVRAHTNLRSHADPLDPLESENQRSAAERAVTGEVCQ